ncbi:TrmH family RNA methyltransferase [Candidatus Dependentiae bacterium]
MKTINSRQNPRIQSLVALKRPKGRKSQGKFIAEGLRVCTTMVEAGWQPEQVYAIQNMVDEAKKIAPEQKITLVDNEVMQKISQATTPSGLLVVFNLPKKPKTEKLGSGIVLANISDPGNMGTLIRTAAAMGLKSVVVVEGADPWGHKVVQATAGTIAKVDVFVWSWEKLLDLKGENKLAALVVRDGQKPDQMEKENTLLVIGNEAHGLPQEWLKDCNQQIMLPMPGNTESLNAAVAGSIGMYLMQAGD